MQHLLVCPMMDTACSTPDLLTASPSAVPDIGRAHVDMRLWKDVNDVCHATRGKLLVPVSGVKSVEGRIIKHQREEIGTDTCIAGRTVEPDEMGSTHGQKERRKIIEKSRDRQLQKTRTTTAKMGGLSEERPKKGRGRSKVERKGQQPRDVEENNIISCTAM